MFTNLIKSMLLACVCLGMEISVAVADPSTETDTITTTGVSTVPSERTGGDNWGSGS